MVSTVFPSKNPFMDASFLVLLHNTICFKLKTRPEDIRGKTSQAQDIIKTLESNKEAMDYLQKPEKDEKHEISILRTTWWEFQIFRLQQPPKQPETVDFLEVRGSSSGDQEELSSLNQIVTGTDWNWFTEGFCGHFFELKRRPFSDQNGISWNLPIWRKEFGG